MRKFLSYTLILTTSLALCTGCGKSAKQPDNNTVAENTAVENATVENASSEILSPEKGELFTKKGTEIISLFDGIMSYEDVLEDVADIDLRYQLDFDEASYREEVIEDTENETETHQYYDGDQLVYEVFEGFGEAGYRTYTKTKSDLDATVNHYELPFTYNEDMHSVTITTDAYTVSFYDGDAEDPFQNTVTVMVFERNDKDLEQSLCYSLQNESIILEQAYYYTPEGYMRYWSWIDDVDQKLYEEEDLLYKNLSEDDISNNIDMLKVYDGPYPIQALLGPHKLATKDGKWYLTTDLFLVFDNKEAASAYIKDAGLSEDALSQEFFDDEDTEKYHVKLDQFTLPIAENFTYNGSDFVSFAENMYDDYSFMVLKLNGQDEVESMDYGDGLELCYG